MVTTATCDRTIEEHRAIEAFLNAIREVGDNTPAGRNLLRILLDTLDFFDALRDRATA